MNSEMRELNVQYYGALRKALLPFDTAGRGISSPHLLSVFPEYNYAKIRILIVGQQTFEWGDHFGSQSVDELMRLYEDFYLLGKSKASPFWNLSRGIYRQLNADSGGSGFMWTNLIKVDEKRKRPENDIEMATIGCFNMLESEINLLKPNVVVFFTGPRYDDVIKQVLPQATLTSIDTFIPNQLSYVIHPSLPPKTYRTYHPKYLRMSKLEQKVLSFITEDAR